MKDYFSSITREPVLKMDPDAHSVRELWTHSDLLSERNEHKSLKNSSERSITESSMSRTPYRGQRSGFTAFLLKKSDLSLDEIIRQRDQHDTCYPVIPQ